MHKVSLEDIQMAQKVLKPVIKDTALLECKELSKITGGNVYLKAENLQLTGSFKIRGAFNKISNLSDAEKAAGVIASSAGNHAQGVALSATKLGIKSTIVMPEIAPLSKVAATKNFGAEVVLHGSVYDDAYAKACEIQKETGATFLHPFDDKFVIAGQGTIGLEILDQLEDVDVVLVPIGGGGIISGISTAIKAIKPSVKIIGVEAAHAPCMKSAIEKGEVYTIDSKATIADGIAVRRAGNLTYEIVKENVDEFVTVTEAEIARAVLLLLEKGKIVAEGAGAVSVAALLNNNLDLKGKNIVSVISGGNLDVNLMERIINKALIGENRRYTLKVKLVDKTGEMTKLLGLIAELKANILTLNQTMYKNSLAIGEQEVKLTLETFDKIHTDKIVAKLTEEGYEILG
ncbi:MAG: threonine ammonia-lyase [Fusobacteriia bacterium 4572_74]|nr:MAG: threonine ammonia-lyase [Fusobacteriia bacterium 4572_74]